MDRETRNAAVAATFILGGFGLAAFYLPSVMIAVGNYSTAVAAVIAVGFVALFFGIFWFRSRSRGGRGS